MIFPECMMMISDSYPLLLYALDGPIAKILLKNLSLGFIQQTWLGRVANPVAEKGGGRPGRCCAEPLLAKVWAPKIGVVLVGSASGRLTIALTDKLNPAQGHRTPNI